MLSADEPLRQRRPACEPSTIGLSKARDGVQKRAAAEEPFLMLKRRGDQTDLFLRLIPSQHKRRIDKALSN